MMTPAIADARLDRRVVEALWPEATVAPAAIGPHEEAILAVWKLDGERDWVPLPRFSVDAGETFRAVQEVIFRGWYKAWTICRVPGSIGKAQSYRAAFHNGRPEAHFPRAEAPELLRAVCEAIIAAAEAQKAESPT